MALIKSEQERYASLRARLKSMPADERLRLVDRYAAEMNISAEEAADWLRRAESGELLADIERLEAEVDRLNAEMRELKRRQSLYVPHDRPWMMAIEMQFAAIRKLDRYTAVLMERARPYAWASDTATAVFLASRTVPMDTRLVRSMLPADEQGGWWWFDSPVDIYPHNGKTCPTCAISFHPGADGLIIGQFFIDYDGDPTCAFLNNWAWDQTLAESAASIGEPTEDDLMRRAAMVEAMRFLAAGFAWLQQRVVLTGSGHVERHRRKQLARENDTDNVAAEVQVIQLRRSESSQRGAVSGASGDAVEWSCRWIVNGHWRNQYYAASGERKLIYIMPFVKGPSDKPLKVPTHTVYQVSR